MIERMPCRPLVAVFDEPMEKLSVCNPVSIVPRTRTGQESELPLVLPSRSIAILPILPSFRNVPARPGKEYSPQIA